MLEPGREPRPDRSRTINQRNPTHPPKTPQKPGPGREPRPDRTRKINQRNPNPHPKRMQDGVLLGTDFRHAVEFSRNGRTPTPPSRASSAAGSSTLRRPPEVCTPRVLSAALAGSVRREEDSTRLREGVHARSPSPAGPPVRTPGTTPARRSAPAGGRRRAPPAGRRA